MKIAEGVAHLASDARKRQVVMWDKHAAREDAAWEIFNAIRSHIGKETADAAE
jgi:hypothetical protein